MEESEERDTYVAQLRDVFDSCDASGKGCLNENEFRYMCETLHLGDHTEILINHLFVHEIEVKFEDFKECFVAILTQAIPSPEDEQENLSTEDITDREVSPKLTWGKKKYGRRSRPASVADDDTPPFLSRQNSVDQLSSSGEVFKSTENLSGKRPMSPNLNQSRPPKSGRMLDQDMTICEEPSRSTSETEESEFLNQSLDNNLVQYLQETWKKLCIGQSGYLNAVELALVCEHIGMEMSEEVVGQLFDKLDCDRDGQISFDEFLQGLFQHGDPQDCDSSFIKPDPSKSLYKEASREDEITNTSMSGIFSSIDVDNSGFAEAQSILELWESLELPCSTQLLEELGFNSSSKVNLSDLSCTLEDVLCNALSRPILQLAFGTFQNELQFLRQTVEQTQRERNKLRVCVEDANSRAALLAQEVDDNHAKLENSLQTKLVSMEKKYQEQARVLADEIQQERECLNSQAHKVKQQLMRDVDIVREEEAKLKSKLMLLQQENSRLESELHETSEKCSEAQKLNEVYQKELSLVPDLKSRLAEFESQFNERQEQSHQTLVQELENYKKVNQELQDKIDELTLEMENMHQGVGLVPDPISSSPGVNRTHSWLSDYKRTVGFKRRSSDSSSEDHSDDESHSSGKIRRTLLSSGKSNSDQELLGPSSPKKKMVNLGLLRDMMMDQSALLRKLQVSEESRLQAEQAFRQSENKNKILSGLLRNMSGAVTA